MRLGLLLGTVALFENTINSDVFYASQALIPVLPKKSVLIMDNASFQADMITAISGTLLEPPYSRQLNPIEKKCAKAIRKREHCDVDTLFSVHFNGDYNALAISSMNAYLLVFIN